MRGVDMRHSSVDQLLADTRRPKRATIEVELFGENIFGVTGLLIPKSWGSRPCFAMLKCSMHAQAMGLVIELHLQLTRNKILAEGPRVELSK